MSDDYMPTEDKDTNKKTKNDWRRATTIKIKKPRDGSKQFKNRQNIIDDIRNIKYADIINFDKEQD